MSFGEDYLKLRKKRAQETKGEAADAQTKNEAESFGQNYMRLRKERAQGHAAKVPAGRTDASAPTGATSAVPSFGDMKRTLTYASPSRAQELLEQYKPHLSQAQYNELAKVSGAFVKNAPKEETAPNGFYERPQPSERLLTLQNLRNAQGTTAEREYGAVKQAQGEMRDLIVKQPDASDRFARRGSDGTYADTMLGMHANKGYQTKNSTFEQRADAMGKVEQAVGEFVPTAKSLAEYDDAYQEEAAAYEKQLADWKSTIRDKDTIQAELDQLNGPIVGASRGVTDPVSNAKRKQLLQEELFWRDYFDHETEYTQYAANYDSGEIPLAQLHGTVADANARIVELEQEIRNLEKWELSEENTAKMSPEVRKTYETKVASQLAALREELKQTKAQVENENREYNYYWSRILGDMQASGAAAYHANSQTEQALNESNARLGKLYHNIAELLEENETGVNSGDMNLTFVADNHLEHMTEEECRIFLYCCNSGNYEAAELWIEDLAPVLTQRKGAMLGEKIDFPVLREAVVLLSSAAQGVENIGYGIASLFADVDAPELSTGDYMVGHLQEKHKGSIAGYTTAVAATVGNQVPSFMAYAVNPALGKAATFFTTRGSAYIDAKRNGASHEEAWVYSSYVGAAETGLEAVLGGLGGRARGIIPDKLSKWLSGAGKRFQGTAGRLVKDYAVHTISELTEENLQNYLEPMFQMFAGMKDHYEAPGWEDFVETSIVTVLSSSVFYASNLPAKARQLKFNETARTWAQKAVQVDENGEIGQYGKRILELLEAGRDISPDYMSGIFALYGDLQEQKQSTETEEETAAQTDADGSEPPMDAKSSVNTPEAEQPAKESAEQPAPAEATQTQKLPDWAAYEAAHKGERYEHDASLDVVDQTGDFELWRDSAYFDAQEYTDAEITQQIEQWQKIRDDGSEDGKNRAIAQYHLDAYEYVQAQRAQKNAALEQQNGGMQNAEGLNDGGQRVEGVGAGGQSGAMEGSAGRSVARGEARTQAAIIRDLKTNGRAQSAKEIGIQNGGEKQTVYVLSEEQVAQSESWSRIRDDAEADGARVVFMVGAAEVFNKSTKKYGKVEGVHLVDAHGQTTYYIRVDKLGRNAEQIYQHEKFHELVSANPGLMVDLMDALDAQFTQQEIAAMVNSYVEAYHGIYGTFSESMTEDEQEALIQNYMNEVFADVYAGIKRGTRSVAAAQKVMRDQTDAVQRAEQNSKAMRNKTAPPRQEYLIGETTDNKPFVEVTEDILANIPREDWVSTVKENLRNKFPNGATVGKNEILIDGKSRKEMTYSRYMQWLYNNEPSAWEDKLRATNNADEIMIATTDWINEGLRHSRRDDIVDFARGTVLLRIGQNDYAAEVVVGTRNNGRMLLYDVLNLERTSFVKKRRDAAKSANPSPGAARSTASFSDDMVSQSETDVKQEFSFDDSRSALEDRVSGDDYLNALDLIEEIKSVGAQVDDAGYVTLYHRTNDAAAKAIYKTGVMSAKEDGLFFSTNAHGENNYGYGGAVVELKVPAEMLVLDDIFADEASVRIPLVGRRRMNVSEYLVKGQKTETQEFSFDDDVEEHDAEYMAAVESGDMKTAQRMVDEAAERAGYTIRAYHQTQNDFTVFDTHHNGAGTSDYVTPFGVFLKPHNDDIGIRGSIQMPLFASVSKPLTVADRHELLAHLRRDEAYNSLYEEIQNRTPEYEKKLKDAENEFIEYLGQRRKENPNVSHREIMESEAYKKTRYIIEEWTRLNTETTEKAKNRIVEFLKEQGYDGVILENDAGSFGRKTKAIIALENTQVKSADPVTYDDNGNVIPLSERFNEKKEDIRYSFDDDVEELDEDFARDMEADEEPEGLAPADDEVSDYHRLAKNVKEGRAQAATVAQLKNRIQSSEQAVQVHRALKEEAKKIGALTKELKEQIDKKIELIRETLQVDRAELKRKQAYVEQEEKEKRKKKEQAEIQNQRARTAQKEIKQDLLNLFSVKAGVRSDIGEQIDSFTDELVRSGKLTNEDRRALFEILYAHGEEIVEADEYFKGVREFMQQGRIYVPESVRADFGDDWQAFQSRAWGNRIYLTKSESDGGIDMWAAELAGQFGDRFTESLDPREQLEMIVDLAEEGKAEHVTLAEMMQRNEDDYGWSVAEQMEELERKVDRMLETFAQKADLEIRLRQESVRKILSDHEHFRKKLESKREAAMESQARNQVMRSIQKLSKMRRKSTPSQQREIDEALRNIDTVARSISARGLEELQDLERRYLEEKEAQGANFLSSPYVEARLDRLHKTQLDDMSIDDVRELGRIVCSIANAIENSRKLLADSKKESVEAAAKDVQKEVMGAKGSKHDKLHKFLLNHMDAKRFFGHISGWAKGTMEHLGEVLSKGQERQMRYQMNAMRIFDDFLADKENQKWIKTAAGKDADWIKVKIPNGFKISENNFSMELSEVEITPMMRVSLLMHSMNEDNLRHIQGGGIRIPERNRYKKGNMKEAYARGVIVKMEPAVVRAIVKDCTEQERAFAKLLQSYFNGMSKDAINEVSMVLDGFERAGGEHYYHIKTDPAFLEKQNDAIKRDLSVAATGSVVNERRHASNPIVLQDATDALMEHIESISKYYAYSIPLRDLNAVLSHTFHQTDNAFAGSVMDTIQRKWGSETAAYIDKLTADLQMPDSSSDMLSRFLTKLRGNYAQAVISANLSSLLKQTTSYPVAYPYLKASGLIAGLKPQSMKADIKTLEKYSAVYWFRNQGNSTMELSDALKSKDFGDRLPWVFNLTQKMDSWTTRRILAACEYRVRKDMGLVHGTQAEIEAGQDRYWSEVAKLFNDVVLKTQSNSTAMERPQITRANASNISRFMTMFRTDAFQQLNMMLEAKGRVSAANQAYKENQTDANKKAKSDAKKFAARTISGTLVGQLGCAAVAVLLKFARLDDEEFRDEEGELDWWKISSYVGLSIVESFCGFLVCGELVYTAASAMINDDEKWYDIEFTGVGGFSDAIESVIDLGRTLKETDLWKGRGAIKEAAFALSKCFGFPAENLEKYIAMGVRWFAPEWTEMYENIWSETTKASLSRESRGAIDEAIGVLMDNRTENLSDEDKSEIARLFMAGGTGSVPSGIPSSVSYTDKDGEEVKVELSASKQRVYRKKWSKVVSSALPALLASEEYAQADDERKTVLIDKLYKYAAQIARNAVVPEKELDKWVAQGETAIEDGVPLAEYICFRVGLTDIDGKGEDGKTVSGMKAFRDMELLEAMGWTDRQEKNIYVDVLASDSAKEQAEALMKAGLTWEQTNDIIVMLGKKWDKMAAITATNASESVKAKALEVYASDKEKKLIRTGLQYGLKMSWYTEVKCKASTDGKDGVTQAEAREYILDMDLTWQEKIYLWQMVTDQKSSKCGLFEDSDLAAMIAGNFYADVHADDPKE